MKITKIGAKPVKLPPPKFCIEVSLAELKYLYGAIDECDDMNVPKGVDQYLMFNAIDKVLEDNDGFDL